MSTSDLLRRTTASADSHMLLGSVRFKTKLLAEPLQRGSVSLQAERTI